MPGILPTLDGRRNVHAPLRETPTPPLIELLNFAQWYLPSLNPPARRIWQRFQLTEIQYHSLLLRSIDDPAAIAMAPALMARLEERRAKAHARRHIQNRIAAEGVPS